MSRPPDQTKSTIEHDLHNFEVARKRARRNEKRSNERYMEVIVLLDRLIEIYPRTKPLIRREPSVEQTKKRKTGT
jgi:hypothetical protein